MIRVYCEHGAMTRELRQLRQSGSIEIVMFRYETRKARGVAWAKPSQAQVRDVEHLSITELSQWPMDEFQGSARLSRIIQVLGPQNRRDALHVDSAYKSACRFFFTHDGDILSKRDPLEHETGMRFFDPIDEWEAFLAHLK